MSNRSVDIVIPIYNSLHVLEPCIFSILENTTFDYKLILVNDGSDEKTKEYLDSLDYLPQVKVITNIRNKGFSATCNKGIKAGTGRYICLLNSDTLVTSRWLEKMVAALEADDKNVIVNPVTNNTALINLELPPGKSYLDINRELEKSIPSYPEINPTGFCFLFRRSLVDEIGPLDEGYTSYGEESDYWMKALGFVRSKDGFFPRYRAVLADNTYIWHERGGSFNYLNDDQWMGLRKAGSNRFKAIHSESYTNWSNNFDFKALKKNLKAKLKPVDHKYNYNLAFITHSTNFCGAINFITDIANQMVESNINVKIVQVFRNENVVHEIIPIQNLRTGIISYNTKELFLENFSKEVFNDGVIVACTAEIGELVLRLANSNPKLMPVNFIQSVDTDLTANETVKNDLGYIYDCFDYNIVNSNYAATKLNLKNSTIVHPGVDESLFYKRDKIKDERPTVLFPLNTTYEFKGYNRALYIMKGLLNKAKGENKEIKIMTYGVNSVPEIPEVIGLGVLNQNQIANLLNEVDLLVDPAFIHTYGMPCVEAIASGVDSISWDNGGCWEYAKANGHITHILDDKSLEEDIEFIYIKLLESFKRDAPKRFVDIPNRTNQCVEFINAVNKMIYKKEKIVIVCPHIRKYGGPSTLITTANLLARRGYDVQLQVIFAGAINFRLTKMCEVPIYFGVENIPECDYLLVNSDSENHDKLSILSQARKKILFKLSHNERFQELEEIGLNSPYDAVITSTNWLRQVTETQPNTEENNPYKFNGLYVMGQRGWDFKPRPAIRVGWYNYSFEDFFINIEKREFNCIDTGVVNIATLIAPHVLKGTNITMEVFDMLGKKYPGRFNFIGVGEAELSSKPPGLNYYYKLDRKDLASLMQQVDIWIGGSYTEGLGRMGLEAMSAGCACVLSNTHSEYVVPDENALIYEPGDIKGCFEQVEKLVLDKELFSKIAINGNETAKKTADPTDYINNLENVLRSL